MSKNSHSIISQRLIETHSISSFENYYRSIKDTNAISEIKKSGIPLAIETHGVNFSSFLQCMVDDTESFKVLLRCISSTLGNIDIESKRRIVRECINAAIENIPSFDNKKFSKEGMSILFRLSDKELLFKAKEKGINFDSYEGYFIYLIIQSSLEGNLLLNADDIEALGYDIKTDRTKWITRSAIIFKERLNEQDVGPTLNLLSELKQKGMQGLSKTSIIMLMRAMNIEDPIEYLACATDKESAVVMNLLSS